MSEKMFMQALGMGIAEEMRIDPKVFLMGEDVRASVYGAAAGLHEEFGDDRVLNTPLSENGFFGAAVGASAVGMRPVVETLTSFMWVGMDQLVSQAAKMRYMFGGQVNLPVVYRAVMYYGGGSAAHHSDRSYPVFMNIGGLKVVTPGTPADAKGLMKTAIRDDDPVIMFEDGTLFGTRGEVPDDPDFTIPFGKANVIREGSDATVVAIAGSVPNAIAAAEQLASEGISVEVVDPRTLVPLDKETILNSVTKTGRLIVADPAAKVCSAASEIMSIVGEEAFWDLQAPMQKVASKQVHIPFAASLEQLVYPTKDGIIEAVKKTLE
ncbi:MAG: alpha-ketoacid dehydrogenase subunit beta [Dehalococcoidia bacterium]|jgi:pyruvate/2-oxoglutarate/acetoin dehydrogenase E1 component